jgi:hypothetical protein
MGHTIEIIGQKHFVANNEGRLFHVGFLKSSQAWFPLCILSDPEEKHHLDTICVSPSLQVMSEVVEAYKKDLPAIEQSLVNYLMVSEIENLMERYALENIALITSKTGGGCDSGGCGCGCGCS